MDRLALDQFRSIEVSQTLRIGPRRKIQYCERAKISLYFDHLSSERNLLWNDKARETFKFGEGLGSWPQNLKSSHQKGRRKG